MHIELSDFRIKHTTKSPDENTGKIIIFHFSNLKKLIVCSLKSLEKTVLVNTKKGTFQYKVGFFMGTIISLPWPP